MCAADTREKKGKLKTGDARNSNKCLTTIYNRAPIVSFYG